MDTVRTRTRGRTQEFVRQSGGHAAHKPILVSLVVGVFSASTFAYLYYDPPPYFQKFENQLRDYMFPSRGSIPTDDAVVFCNIDDEAAEVIGQWPLPRTYYSQLINALSESNTIGFDILFLERGMISNSEAVEATNKFRGLLEVVQRLLGGEEEKQQETLQHLSDIFKSASASIGGPDGLLALSASEHKRIL
ncbi:MAG: CHASE2 domain-containing protein, partial [Planctomycetota bacterium]|nr:CHASE2 domain-containing protein [Planctomycetota bacterium]